MFGIGETELVIILAFGFMIFGPDKLPGMGRTIGRALRQFRQAQEGFTQVVQSEVMDPLQEAMGDPLETGTRAKRRATAEERAAALAADADIDGDATGEPAAHKETFAERKARLAAERKAREQEALAQAQAADEDAPESVEPQVAEAQEAPAAEPAAPDTSAAALYNLGGRSSFGAAKQQAAEKAAAKEAEAAAAKEAEAAAAKEAEAKDAEAPAEPASDAVEPTTDGKEAGSTEA